MILRYVFAALFVLLIQMPLKAQFHWGAEVGYTNSRFAVENPIGSNISSKATHGFQFTAIASYVCKDILWLESGISFQQKGTSFDPDLTFGYVGSSEGADYDPFSKIQIRTNSVEVPLWVGAKINPSKNLSIIPKAGFFIAMDVWGKGITEGVDFDKKPFRSSFDILYGTMEMGDIVNPPDYRDLIKPVNMGPQVGFDVMWNQWALRTAYKWGIPQRDFFAYGLKSRMLSVSLGYFIK